MEHQSLAPESIRWPECYFRWDWSCCDWLRSRGPCDCGRTGTRVYRTCGRGRGYGRGGAHSGLRTGVAGAARPNQSAGLRCGRCCVQSRWLQARAPEVTGRRILAKWWRDRGVRKHCALGRDQHHDGGARARKGQGIMKERVSEPEDIRREADAVANCLLVFVGVFIGLGLLTLAVGAVGEGNSTWPLVLLVPSLFPLWKAVSHQRALVRVNRERQRHVDAPENGLIRFASRHPDAVVALVTAAAFVFALAVVAIQGE